MFYVDVCESECLDVAPVMHTLVLVELGHRAELVLTEPTEVRKECAVSQREAIGKRQRKEGRDHVLAVHRDVQVWAPELVGQHCAAVPFRDTDREDGSGLDKRLKRTQLGHVVIDPVAVADGRDNLSDVTTDNGPASPVLDARECHRDNFRAKVGVALEKNAGDGGAVGNVGHTGNFGCAHIHTWCALGCRYWLPSD